MTLSLTPAIPALQVASDVADSVPRAALGTGERREMFALLDRHFEGVTPAQFARDLEEKDWVLRIRREERLVGFTTLQLYRASINGTCAQVLYSGDTIMAPEAWASPVLARGWIALVRALQGVYPGERWYWLLLSSGFRTYRFLPVFWRDFWPRHDAEPPAEVRETLRALATARFGGSYDAAAGVVRFAHPQRLRGALADVPDGRADDPHVRYFLERNPGWGAGDELVCLTELSDANLTAAGVRMVRGDARRAATQTPAGAVTIGATLANALWLASVHPGARRFQRALDQPGTAQWRWLARQLQQHASSEFGRAHDFGRIDSPRAFARAVELCTYDDLAPHIARIRAGERDVLATGRVTHLAPTSGSTGARKLIPFNAALQAGFGAAVGAWMHDLVRQRRALVGGPAYWSISPLTEEAETRDAQRAAIPIGFADDADYLGAASAWLVRQTMAAPSSLRHVRDTQPFWRLTVLSLLRRRALRLISAWHPSFVDLLMEAAGEAWEELLEAVATGTCPWIAALPPDARAGWTTAPDRRRADELRRAGRDAWPSWWPQLQVVSCWGEQGAEAGWRSLARRLSAHASHVLVQPKGLLATEGVVTIPYATTHVLALTSHFFEFLDREGNVRLAQELDRGGEYEVVLSNGGGLWRYRLGDMVACTGHLKATPTLQFLGRAGSVSDLRGEKLSEAFVARALRGAREGDAIPAYVALRAWYDGVAAGYELLVADAEDGDGALTRDAAHEARLCRVEHALCENPHYALARRLGQLQPLRESSVSRDAARDDLRSHPGRLGDAKPRLLLPAVERHIAPGG